MSKELPKDGLLLASASPRRKHLLTAAGLNPVVAPVTVVEEQRAGESPRSLVARLAQEKAAAALEEYSAGAVVLAADTIVIQEGRVLGKPADKREARRMLLELRDRSHEVLTALTLIDRASGATSTEIGRTVVTLRPFDSEELDGYIESESPLDKAGGYGIQDVDFEPVDLERFSGCFTNVMGLPLCLLGRGLKALGWSTQSDLAKACNAYRRHEVEEAMVGA